ncbi:MAG: ATP-binding protein [Coriobacteriia bacterium]
MTVSLISLLPLASSILSLVLAVAITAVPARRTRATGFYISFNVFAAAWSFSYFLQINQLSLLPAGIAVDRLGNAILVLNGFAVAGTITYWAAFLAWHAGYRQLTSGRPIVIVQLVGAYYAISQATNGWHHLYITSSTGVSYTYGPLAYVNHSIAYLAAVGALVMVAHGTRTGKASFNAQQAAAVIAATSIPLMGGAVYTLREQLGVALAVHPAALLFPLVSIVLAFFTLRARMGDVLPMPALVAFERMSDAAVVLDGTGRIAALNHAFLHVAPHAENGLALKDVEPNLAACLVVEDGVPAPSEFEYWDATAIWWVRVVSGDALGVGAGARLVLLTDLTTIRNAEANMAALNQQLSAYICELEDAKSIAEERTGELEMANDQLAVATRAKDRFLANVSHELRTPLTSIIGLSSSLALGRVGELNEEQKSFTQIIGDAGRHLLSLIEDLLDLEKTAAGSMDVVLEPTDLTATIAAVTRLVKPQFEENGLYLITEIQECPFIIDTDERRLKQVLLNLLGNAAKFTDQGGVRIRAFKEEGQVVIQVADTGVGIPEEHIDRIFMEFEQVPGARGLKAKGAGLGLSISRRLAELLGGSLEVCSSPKRGACFIVRLPESADALAQVPAAG